MKNHIIRLSVVAGAVLSAGVAHAQYPYASHYPAGAEGIKGASLPPSGFYFRDYNFVYTAGNFANVTHDFDVTVYVNAPRIIWMSDWHIFGATYGADVIVPFGYTDMKLGGQKFHGGGLGDIQVEPLLLAWHFDKFDLSAGYAFWAPTGVFDVTDPSTQGAGFWTHMLTFGGTVFFDSEKTWAFSLLNRYEFNHENTYGDAELTPGQTLTMEWGLSKSLKKTIDVGVIGYYQQQTTETSGSGLSVDKAHVVGLGPEISAVCPKLGLISSLRYNYEFAAFNRPEGHKFTLTFTYKF
jgi:hypothetical protein